MTNKKFLILVLTLFLTFTSCGSEVEKVIPQSPVYLNIDLASGRDGALNSPGNTITYINPTLATDRLGYSGLLAYCSMNGIGNGKFYIYVFDLCCPNERQQNIRIEPIGNGKAKCSKCNTVYDLTNGIGNVESGPSKNNLQIYRVDSSQSGQGLFFVRN